MCYPKLLWKGFESQWKKEFRNAEIKENPLFVAKGTEVFNPLYKGKDSTGTSTTKHSTVYAESEKMMMEKQAGMTRERQLGGKRDTGV